MLLCFLGNIGFATASQRDIKSLAEVSLIKLKPDVPISFQPSSDQGFIVVALQDCTVMLNEQKEILRTANFRRVRGKRILQLASSASTNASLVLITIKNTYQDLTIEDTVLTHRQELEDASDRNVSLLVAISPMQLRDVRDQNGEGESWKSSNPTIIKLSAGQTVWLPPGMHRFRNLGDSTAHFVTIEW